MISEEKFLNDLKKALSLNDEISMDTDLLDLEGWDSFSAMLFISMANDKYGITVEPFAVAEAVLIEDLYEIIVSN